MQYLADLLLISTTSILTEVENGDPKEPNHEKILSNHELKKPPTPSLWLSSGAARDEATRVRKRAALN